jgi:hypothetical protein
MFSYYFTLMMEGSGSLLLTNGSGSERPKNIEIWSTDNLFPPSEI